MGVKHGISFWGKYKLQGFEKNVFGETSEFCLGWDKWPNSKLLKGNVSWIEQAAFYWEDGGMQ
jgi:hypothetical protein